MGVQKGTDTATKTCATRLILSKYLMNAWYVLATLLASGI